MNKNIIITGYPKSGTTWVSGLVAELIQCPLVGDWGFDNSNCPYVEGLERNSSFRCFKSHQAFNELKDTASLPIHKIIYIVRDPRDIVISGIYYFSFSIPFVARFLKNIGLKEFEMFLSRIINKLLTKREKKRQLIKSVLKGDKNVNYWFKFAWKEHCLSFKNQNILCLKYEDILAAPEVECEKIMKYLKLSITKEHIEESIKKQSFELKKENALNQKNVLLKKLIRKGRAGSWKKELSKKEKDIFHEKLNSFCSFYKF